MDANVLPAVDSASLQATGSCQYLTFFLESQLFAVGILSVKEIIQFGQITSVPMMPDYLRGVINLRGAVVPVIDINVRFGRQPAKHGRRTSIVILGLLCGDEEHDIGILVDSVSEVVDIAGSQIEPTPTFGTAIHPEFIAGMGKIDGRFVVILDIESTFSAVGFSDVETHESH